MSEDDGLEKDVPTSADYLAEVITVKVADLFVDHRYQRGIKKTSVNNLLKHWSWKRYLPIIVAHRGGQGDRYAVIDGQQRFMAAQELGIKTLPAILIVARDVETEAEMFVGANTGASVGAGDRFKAEYLRKEPRIMSIVATIRGAGFFCGPLRDLENMRGPDYFTIYAIHSVERIFDQGYLFRVLTIIGDSFSSEGNKDMVTGNFMEGVYLALRHLDRFEVPDELLSKSLQGVQVKQLLDMGYERYKSMVTSRSIPGGIAAVLVERFNYRKRPDQVVPPYDRAASRALKFDVGQFRTSESSAAGGRASAAGAKRVSGRFVRRRP